MREWWCKLPPERKREYLDKRVERRGDQIREADRRRNHRPKAPLEYRKRRAHWTVHNAIRDGRLVREPCEVCGVEPADAHHDDYDAPLDVRWLCRAHHGEQHRKYPEAA